MLVYLSGSIEFADDGGRGWRRDITAFLTDMLGHQVYDPALDEKKNLTDEEAANFRQWKVEAPERFREVVRKIIDWDLDWVENKADYIICYWDAAAARGAGTQSELTAAYRRGIPVFLVTEMPLTEVSGWVLACADAVLPDFDTLRARLAERFRN